MALSGVRQEYLYICVQKMQEEGYAITETCDILNLNRSSYYKWTHRSKSSSELENEALLHDIGLIYAEHNGTYGYRRIADEYNATHEKQYNLKRFYRLVHIVGLLAVIRRKRPAYQRSTPEVTAENILNREFTANTVNEKWCTDVTEMKYGSEGENLLFHGISQNVALPNPCRGIAAAAVQQPEYRVFSAAAVEILRLHIRRKLRQDYVDIRISAQVFASVIQMHQGHRFFSLVGHIQNVGQIAVHGGADDGFHIGHHIIGGHGDRHVFQLHGKAGVLGGSENTLDVFFAETIQVGQLGRGMDGLAESNHACCDGFGQGPTGECPGFW